MSKRMKWLLAALALVALVVVLDRPDEKAQGGEVSEVSERAERRASRAPAPAPLLAPSVARVASVDAPVPDLFAAIPGQPGGAGAPSPRDGDMPAKEKGDDGDEPAFRLLGFKEEDGERAAYLEHEGRVFTARKGANLAGQYRVVKVEQERVEIRDNGSGALLRIGFRDEQ
ncbi:MAG: hypothetical protein ACLGI6_11075 [Gammaproteobacteria bacterium]